MIISESPLPRRFQMRFRGVVEIGTSGNPDVGAEAPHYFRISHLKLLSQTGVS